MASERRRPSSERPEMNWRVRAICRDPLDPRLLARLFIQMALERAETERSQPEQATPAPNTSRA